MRRWLAVAAVAGSLAPAPASAQKLSASISHWFTSPSATEYTGSVGEWGLGPFRIKPQGMFLDVGDGGAKLLGAGLDGRVPVGSRQRFFLVGGVGAGFLDLKASLGLKGWWQWSAGTAYELVRTTGFGIQLEARYADVARSGDGGGLGGFVLGIRAGNPFGHSSPKPLSRTETATRPAAPSASWPPPLATAGRGTRSPADAPAMAVVDAAQSVMGAPYRWGGTSANGFDCSGLIQYAYAQVGIDLPRRSVEQAGTGTEITPQLDQLRPGDILTFAAAPGGRVTHVGLYLGEGRFIHSSSAGVRISGLDPADPEGAWWWPRWIGARRVL
jgi:cell wall-associated NlpC family hydrolase